MIHPTAADSSATRSALSVRPTAVIVGAGVAGLTAAHVLARTHAVTLIEADERVGGHAHTHTVRGTAGPGSELRVDSGFIVHNERTYPTLLRLWGPDTDIVAPKGIVLNAGADTLFVADFGAADVKVFDGTSIGDSAPLFSLTALGAAPWDVAYDDAADRLFVALVNGTVLVYDDLLANQGGVAARTITPTDDQDVKLSVNLHGIEYDAAADLLLLSDVGSAMSNSDGQLFLIGAASTADGNVPVQAQVGGNMTKLGNPVDIAYDGVNLYVAEKINSQVLRYDNFTALTGANNVAESAARMVTNPESVSLFFTLVP